MRKPQARRPMICREIPVGRFTPMLERDPLTVHSASAEPKSVRSCSTRQPLHLAGGWSGGCSHAVLQTHGARVTRHHAAFEGLPTDGENTLSPFSCLGQRLGSRLCWTREAGSAPFPGQGWGAGIERQGTSSEPLGHTVDIPLIPFCQSLSLSSPS